MNIPSADTDAWNTAEGMNGGKPSFIRYRPNLAHHIGDSQYPTRLVIVWEFDPADLNGQPSNAQSDNMRLLEDSIVSAVDYDRSAVLAFVFTKAGIREWHFYIKDVGEAGSRINSALKNHPKYPITMQVEKDRNWNAYSDVLSLVN